MYGKTLAVMRWLEGLQRPSRILFCNVNVQMKMIHHALKCGHNVSILKQSIPVIK